MIPLNEIYPVFKPDQLLTSEHLNSMFSFLEEQDRLTRTNLIGIGIVCGLNLTTASDGSSITISGGTGVTSEGYLISIDQDTYTRYNTFDAVKPEYYDLFVSITNDGSGDIKKQKYDLWEIFPKSTTDGTALSASFLNDKVCLLFYEIDEEAAKNCDTTSCDDKGIKVTINIRKLLIGRDDADKLIADIQSQVGDNYISQLNIQDRFNLAEIKIPIFNVPAGSLILTSDIYEAYESVLNQKFIDLIAATLSKSYAIYKYFVSDIYTGDPFATFKNNFKFLWDGTINGNDLLNIQYYYDFFSDILEAYDELRLLSQEIISKCCPDDRLFPRHLMLGELYPQTSQVYSDYRNYFIPSPLFANNLEDVDALRLLFKRLVLIISELKIPVPNRYANNLNVDLNIRVTPSKLGCVPLSEKSIPWYYLVNDGPMPLYQNWNFKKTKSAVFLTPVSLWI